MIKKNRGTNMAVRLVAFLFVLACFAGVSGAQTAGDAYFATVNQLRADGFSGIDKALAGFEAIIKKNPGYIFAYLSAADTYLLKYEFSKTKEVEWLKKAGRHLDSAMKLQPALPEAYFKRATIRFNLNEKEAAEGDLLKAIDLLPEYADARIMYLQYLLSEGKLERAKTFAEESVAVAPYDPSAPKLLGDVFMREKAYKEAIWLYQKVVALTPSAPFTYLAIGKAYSRLGDKDKAIGAFRKSLQQGQGDGLYEVKFLLGVLLSEKGEYNEAAHFFEGFLKKFPGDISTMNNLALVYEKTGKTAKAKLMWIKIKNAGDDTRREKAERKIDAMTPMNM